MVNIFDPQMSIRNQCEILGLNRSTLYYQPVPVSELTLTLMNMVDEQFTKTPFYGVRKLRCHLKEQGYEVGKDRVRSLMRMMGIEAVYPGPNTSKRRQEHKIYPYLLRGVKIIRPNQVWSIDITYIRLLRGFLYLVAIIDWFSRYVLSWRLSNSLETDFCLEALEESFRYGIPNIFNSDQGCQFTSDEFTSRLLNRDIAISMDSRGRALDNIFVERLWRSVKYENVYLKGYETVPETQDGLTDYFDFYNNDRYHQSLAYRRPRDVHFG